MIDSGVCPQCNHGWNGPKTSRYGDTHTQTHIHTHTATTTYHYWNDNNRRAYKLSEPHQLSNRTLHTTNPDAIFY